MAGKNKFVLLMVLCGLLIGFAVGPAAAQEDTPPVAEDGPYAVGIQILNLVDTTRENHELQTFVWYPAIPGDTRPYPPDEGGAPYPLIIYSHGYGGSATESTDVINRLVSHGFVVAGPAHADAQDNWFALVDRPLDIAFVLDQLTNLEDNSLVGLIDTDNVGVMGFSFGGYTTLTAGGAQVDMNHFREWCGESGDELPSDYCVPSLEGGDVATYYAERHTDETSENGLWWALNDERIKAILPIAPCFGQMFGIEGLAGVRTPVLIVGGTNDAACPYELDSAYYYANLGSADRYLVTLDKRNHLAVIGETNALQQYAAAFFGYYLQGKDDYSEYLRPESAAGFRDVTLESTLAE